MSQFGKNKQIGMVLLLTLIFLFVLTLIAVSDSDDVIINHKMQSAIHAHLLIFMRAEWGMQKIILAHEGIFIDLPDSPIMVHAQSTVIKTDRCGNQTILIQSIGTDHAEKVVLNSLHIFARVPKLKKCKKIQLHQCLWWREAKLSA
ncbi:MAG: hypothetical protein COY58_04865 [Gammaproteobacteria bacterium CG_4_10_14_0_8_um_filter_38_16]|nr:MAG: hypothetical protein COY58_04865 [Gammaproteobacteria bacterium CG_4_10_14_0_8_um_filter_38_16]PJA03347.1 MAG: hypothetical protein COX72_05590 [Gammaproteobacteria bacterium CG_4_10_14_0_2_um_filter_38_22]PJB10661.1 MAG: hypothetical protein CO120_03670 [Gammaproteobacteria bacterium CG_4_9_14_3_um_filter_38_9]